MTVAEACDLDQWIVQRSQLVRGRPFRKSSYNLILATIDSKHEIPPQPGSVAQRYTSWYRRACLGGVTRKKEFSLGNLEAGGEGGDSNLALVFTISKLQILQSITSTKNTKSRNSVYGAVYGPRFRISFVLWRWLEPCLR
jgi:hypothetical protein